MLSESLSFSPPGVKKQKGLGLVLLSSTVFLVGCNLFPLAAPCSIDANCPQSAPICISRVCVAEEPKEELDDGGPAPSDGGESSDAGTTDGGPAPSDGGEPNDAGVVRFPYDAANVDESQFTLSAVVDLTGCTTAILDVDNLNMSRFIGCTPALSQNSVVEVSEANDLRVLAMRSLHIPEGVRLQVVGENALAFLVSEDVTLAGVLDVRGMGTSAGPGGRTNCGNGNGGAGTTGSSNSERCSGGGGGGFGGDGEEGGKGDNGATEPGSKGVVNGNDILQPLRGGCAGGTGGGPQGGIGGGGGGAVQLSVGGTLDLTGTILAGGGGGGAAQTRQGGGGGGSGGGILLEANTVNGDGNLFANGGGGGSGGGKDEGNVGAPGADALDENGGNGGNGDGNGPSSGGDGGGGASNNSGAGKGELRRYGGGGGGGGVGRILVKGHENCSFNLNSSPSALLDCP
ncbi:MAG: hypothetical protein GY822_20035 [Deltaproteobacteria bacterium]|nr:hypothetical protein [Deltaproteobacteria bacterium]